MLGRISRKKDAGGALAHEARGGDVVLVAGGGGHAAGEAGEVGDVDEGDGQCDAARAVAEQEHEAEGEDIGGERVEQLHDAADGGVDEAAAPAGEHAEDGAGKAAEHEAGEAHGEGDLGTVGDAGEDVLAEAVGAEGVQERGGLEDAGVVLVVGVVGGERLDEDYRGGGRRATMRAPAWAGRLVARVRRARFMLCGSGGAAGIEKAAGDVDKEVGGDDDGEEDDGAALDNAVVAGEGGVDHDGADPGDAEDALDDDDAAEEVAGLEADGGDIGDEGVAEHVVDEDERGARSPWSVRR